MRFSQVHVDFTLERIPDVYESACLRSVIFVFLSYLGCYISKTAATARVALGILMVVVVGNAVDSVVAQLPPLRYGVWLIDFHSGCLYFNVLSFVLYASVNFADQIDTRVQESQRKKGEKLVKIKQAYERGGVAVTSSAGDQRAAAARGLSTPRAVAAAGGGGSLSSPGKALLSKTQIAARLEAIRSGEMSPEEHARQAAESPQAQIAARIEAIRSGELSPEEVRQRSLFVHFLYENDHFTKTGSGQTQGKLKNETVSSQHAAEAEAFLAAVQPVDALPPPEMAVARAAAPDKAMPIADVRALLEELDGEDLFDLDAFNSLKFRIANDYYKGGDDLVPQRELVAWFTSRTEPDAVSTVSRRTNNKKPPSRNFPVSFLRFVSSATSSSAACLTLPVRVQPGLWFARLSTFDTHTRWLFPLMFAIFLIHIIASVESYRIIEPDESR
jgi:hypothetical protein